MAETKILLRGLAVESLVRADAVVDGFPFAKGAVEGLDLQIAVVDIVELLDVGSVGALDMAIELGGARGQDEEADAPLLTGVFEDSVELRAAVDLEGLDGERHPPDEGVEEVGGSGGGGPGMSLDHIPAADDISGGEVLEHDAGQGAEVDGIDLDQVPGGSDGIASGLAYGIASSTLVLICESDSVRLKESVPGRGSGLEGQEP